MTLLAASQHAAERTELSAGSIRISCNELFGSMAKQTTMKGNVEFSSARVNLTAEQVTADWEEGRPTRVVAKGDQTRIVIRQDETNTLSAVADEIDYELSNSQVELRGNVEVNDGDRRLQSDFVRYDIERGEFTATSLESAKQVEIVWESEDSGN